MTMNNIQFQAGLSMPEFIKRYGTEAQCVDALMSVRWPGGFQCPRCGSSTHHVLHGEGRKTFQCGACRHQASVIAGTLFQATKLPLTIWFLAIYLISQAKTGLSALALKRQLGVSYPTAWPALPRSPKPTVPITPRSWPAARLGIFPTSNVSTRCSAISRPVCRVATMPSPTTSMQPAIWLGAPGRFLLPLQPPLQSANAPSASSRRCGCLAASAAALDSVG